MPFSRCAVALHTTPHQRLGLWLCRIATHSLTPHVLWPDLVFGSNECGDWEMGKRNRAAAIVIVYCQRYERGTRRVGGVACGHGEGIGAMHLGLC